MRIIALIAFIMFAGTAQAGQQGGPEGGPGTVVPPGEVIIEPAGHERGSEDHGSDQNDHHDY